MSTNDVPGANPSNSDELAMGCWAEHEDGSLILVENTEGDRVIYSIFDVAKEPMVEYRDAMPEIDFKKTFTWDPKKKASIKWTWHDKTQFPWDRIIKEGAQDGHRLPSAEHYRSAAERIAESIKLRANEVSRDKYAHMSETRKDKLGRFIDRLFTMLDD